VRTLLVIGASGYLGAEVCRQASGGSARVVGTWLTTEPGAGVDARRLDVRDRAAVERLVAEVAPDAVVHTAYVQEGDAARATNADGAGHVAAAARGAGARLVHLSTDIVFSGRLGRPIREDDPPDPVTAYGATKADGERAAAAADPGAVLVRTSLIYGGPGRDPSSHERLALEAARGERDVRFFEDEWRNPVQVGDLAAALLELVTLDVAGPLHVAGADRLDRLAFARLIAAARGGDPGRLAPGRRPPDRPADCTLDCSRAAGLLRTRLRGAREVLAR
jgi:dTDP-4-dehydrorhamnose reductase